MSRCLIGEHGPEVVVPITVHGADPQAVIDALRGYMTSARKRRQRQSKTALKARQRRQWHKAVHP